MSTINQFPPEQKESQQQNYQVQYGWECPRCGQINAPWAPHCNCKGQTITTTTTTIPASNALESMQQGWITYDPKPGWNSENNTSYYICKEKE